MRQYSVYRVLTLGMTAAVMSVCAHASSATWNDWEHAKELYDAQHYQQALDALKEKPLEQANYYYNTGTIYYRLAQYGLSVAYLEKANRIQPHDSDIQYNLSVVKAALGKQIGQQNLDPASTWTERLADRVTANEIRATLGLLGLIVVGLWIRSYRSTRSMTQSIFNPAGILGLIGLSLTLGVFVIHQYAENSRPAICIASTSVWSGPGTHYMQLGAIQTGTKVRLLSEAVQATVADQAAQTNSLSLIDTPSQSTPHSSHTWVQIRFSADGIGWIESPQVMEL